MNVGSAGSILGGFSIPAVLNFAGYIGFKENFKFGFQDEIFPKTEAEKEWEIWWNSLATNPIQMHWQLTGSPPDFANSGSNKELQTLCSRHWNDYKTEWDANKPILAEKLGSQFERLLFSLNNSGSDKSQSTKQLPQADFVLWPSKLKYPVSAEHVILGADYLEPANLIQLQTYLRANQG